MIDSWKWNDVESKIHCDSRDERDLVLRIGGSRESGVYTVPGQNRQYDVIIPSESVVEAKRLIRCHGSKKSPKTSSVSPCGSRVEFSADSQERL